MGFGDLKSDAGIKSLNDFLCDKSYVEGFVPSQADVVVFLALAQAPGSSYSHALRWYNQIKSYSSDEQQKFPGTKGPLSDYGPRGNEQAPAKGGDDDFDLFGDDDEDEEETEEEKRIKEERLAAYAAKKAGKKKVIAKSSVLFEVSPWSDEEDPKILEELTRKIEADGLLWGASKLVDKAYGLKVLQIAAVIEDDKISTEWLTDEVEANEEYVQSMKILAFNKI